MALCSFKIIRIISKFETTLGVHRNFNQTKSKLVMSLKILQLIIFNICLLLYVSCYAYSLGQIINDNKMCYAVWLLFLTFQYLEGTFIQTMAMYYSTEYKRLFQIMQKNYYQLNIYNTHKKFKLLVIFVCTINLICICMNLFWLYLMCRQVANIYMIYPIFLLLGFNFMLLVHYSHVIICSLFYILIDDIIRGSTIEVIKMNKAVNNYKQIRNYNEIHINSIKNNMNIGLDNIWRIYTEIVNCCNICNNIFGLQVTNYILI